MGDILALIGLSLLDSLSLGTLVIPLALILRRGRVELAPLLTYLLTVCVVYFLLGVSLMLGFTCIADSFETFSRTHIFSWICLVLGFVLALFGILSRNPKKKTVEEIEASVGDKNRAIGGVPAMVLLGTGASLVEAVTMLPYLAGIGIITNFNTDYFWKFATLAGYCLVMILPALIIIFQIRALGERAMNKIRKWIPKLQYETKITLLWIAAIVGVRMVLLSLQDLNLW